MARYRTPLRYPGGKQRLAPFIKEIIAENDLIGGHYVEPYAGGAGVAMELLLDGAVSHVHLNDSSYPVFAFWESVLTAPDQLCRRIFSASLTVEEWTRRRDVVRNYAHFDVVEVGFSTLYLNRCNRSGVISGGIIGGLDQSGPWKMDARFPRNELIQRIEAIASRGDRITVTHMDAEQFMLNELLRVPQHTLVYCDPPYYGQKSRLYLNKYSPADHASVAQTIQGIGQKWVVSYDNCPPIAELYGDRRMMVYGLQYNASRVYTGEELFIFSDNLTVPLQSSVSYLEEPLRILASRI